MARTLALSSGVCPQRMINHLHHDLEMKRYHLAGVSKSWKSALLSDHAGRARCSRPDKCLIPLTEGRPWIMYDQIPSRIWVLHQEYVDSWADRGHSEGDLVKRSCELARETGDGHRGAKWALWVSRFEMYRKIKFLIEGSKWVRILNGHPVQRGREDRHDEHLKKVQPSIQKSNPRSKSPTQPACFKLTTFRSLGFDFAFRWISHDI
jgi:hypothetical protein